MNTDQIGGRTITLQQVSGDVTFKGNPQRATTPAVRQCLFQQGITRWNHNHSLGGQSGSDFTLGRGDGCTTPQPTDVCRTDVGDHGNLRLSTTGKTFNLTQAAHAHFQHHSSMALVRTHQGERHPDVVVVVADRGLNISKRRKRCSDQLTGRCLPG